MATLTKPLALSAALIAAALALSACSSPSGSSSMPGMDHGSAPMATASASAPAAADRPFNDADVMFAQMMVPHHEQAVSMADAVLAKPGLDPRVVSLATRIKDTQQPEIGKLRSWLRAWSQPTSPAAGHTMDGMTSQDDMSKLSAAEGPTAAKLFLSQMIAHHEGALTMAKTEASGGKSPDAVAMAKSVVDSQGAEITEMKALLASL